MSSNRCLHCGFLNFAEAEVCKRCQATLAQPNYYENNQPEPGYNPYWNNEQNPWGVPPGGYWGAPPPPPPLSPFRPAGAGAGGHIGAIILILLAAYFTRIYLFFDAKEGCGVLSMAYELGLFTGYLLGVSLTCYIIWRFLFQKTKRRLVLNIFMAAVGVLSAWQIHTEYTAMKIAKETIRRMVSKNGGLTTNTGFLQKETSPPPSGRFERAARTMEDYIIDLHNESAAYIADVDGLGGDSFLAPGGLVGLQNVQRKRQQLANLLASVNRHEEQIRRLATQGDTALSSVDLEGCVEREFVLGARVAFSTISKQASEFFVIQRDLVKQMDQLLAFLEEKSGKYAVRYDYLEFSTDEDAESYNSLVARLGELVEREEQWVRQAQEKQAKNMKGLESFIR
jgi:hypothetical protein